MMRLRSWAALADTTAVQQLASRLWPLGPHPGGVGWDAASGQLPSARMLADDGGVVAGWAGVTGAELVVQADPPALRPPGHWSAGLSRWPGGWC